MIESEPISNIKPITQDDFALYNGDGKKVHYLGQEYEDKPIEWLSKKQIDGYRYIGRRELRKICDQGVYLFDAYRFEKQDCAMQVFNYNGEIERSKSLRLYSFYTTSKDFETIRGIKVGNTKKDVLEKYGETNEGDSSWFVYSVNDKLESIDSLEKQIIFSFDQNKVEYIYIYNYPDPAVLQYVEFPDKFE